MKTTSSTFEQFISHPLLLENLVQKMGFAHPTPIQEAVAPIILEGKNLFAGAKTGSGKTVAFLTPIAQRIFEKKAEMALILAPTRELVLQIDEEAARLLDGQADVVSVPLYGGVPIDPQILAIRHHRPRIFIATPGRVLDLAHENLIPFHKIDIAVLDEADRMCDMGFAPQVTQIMNLLSGRSQTLLFSATLPKVLNDIMGEFCADPQRIQLDAADQSSETIEHTAILCTRRDKLQKLVQVLRDPAVHGLIFVRTRIRADELYRRIGRDLKNVGVLHAGFNMSERERTIRDFREGRIRVLIATDVVSRGIDVDKITHVIHFDLPDALEDYIHRSGRSGRAGRAGQTFAMVETDNRDQSEKFQQLKKKVQFTMMGRAAQLTDSPPRSSRPPSGSRPHTSNRPHGGNKSYGDRKPRSGQARTRRPERENTVTKKTKPPSTGIISKTKTLFKKVFSRKKKSTQPRNF